MKILVVRFSSIGDIVLTTPVVRCLKTQLNAEIHFATKEQYQSLLQSNPYIDKIFFLKDSLSALIHDLKLQNYDCVIDLHRNLRTRILKWRLGVEAFSFNKLNIEKWLMVNFKINHLPDQHIVDRYLETTKPLGVENDALGLDYFIPESDEMPWEWLPETHRHGFVAYAIGGQHETKKLPLKRMIELCKKINQPLVLLGGKEDSLQGESIKRELGESIFNACGKLNVNQSASLLKKSWCVFSHDTGLMHIAAALKKEVFSIWGNTIPAFGMYPYRTKYHVIENTQINCRPCSKIGFSKCPKGHFKCMNEMKFDFQLNQYARTNFPSI